MISNQLPCKLTVSLTNNYLNEAIKYANDVVNCSINIHLSS